ncbi:MAG: hypothetical protein JKY00_12780 [Roseicyclus sp.]|nr:hypothetical protein [Roseicyclus sp.]
MTISPELQLALFALDSYNRGYGSGLVDEQPASGDVDGLGTIGSGLAFGTMIRESDTAEGAPGVEAGFYAAAYSVTSGDLAGKTVISFRGTDNIAGEGQGGNDIVNGWFGGQGQQNSQLQM